MRFVITINPTNADTDTIDTSTDPLYPLCLLLVTIRLLVVKLVRGRNYLFNTLVSLFVSDFH